MAQTDEELVQRARGGDQRAFSALVDRYRDMVYGLGYHLTGDFEAARDLAQEALVQAFVNLAQLREAKKFGAWLRGIAQNVHRTRCQRKGIPTVPLNHEVHSLSGDRRASELEAAVREALGRLRQPERLALTLHYINGYSHAEIGGFLGVRPETVKTRLARARQSLREELLQMAEDMFREHALPAEFRQDVIAAVNRLLGDLRCALPVNLQEVRERLRQQCDEAWSRVVTSLPATWRAPLKRQGEAKQIPVADLPEGPRQVLRDCLCRYWLYALLGYLESQVSWTSDSDAVSVRFHEEAGEPQVHLYLRGGPGSVTYKGDLGEDNRARQWMQATDEAEKGLAQHKAQADSTMPPDVRQVLGQLREAFPEVTGSVARATWDEMQHLLREAGSRLPSNVRTDMQAGQEVRARELPEPSRGLLMRAEALHWAVNVMASLAYPPRWLTNLDASTVEFGVRPSEASRPGSFLLLIHLPGLAYGYGFSDPVAGPGKPYIKVYGPDRPERPVLDVGIPEPATH